MTSAAAWVATSTGRVAAMPAALTRRGTPSSRSTRSAQTPWPMTRGVVAAPET